MLDDLLELARGYARLQHEAVLHADAAALHSHIRTTLSRCLPAWIVTPALVDCCALAVQNLPADQDPMHTGAIHAFAGRYLLASDAALYPGMQKLHVSALRLLPQHQAATREDLRLVTLDALYQPGMIPPGIAAAFLQHRLGLNGHPRLSCEEIALRMHKPLTYIHELESSVLTVLTSRSHGGQYAR